MRSEMTQKLIPKSLSNSLDDEVINSVGIKSLDPSPLFKKILKIKLVSKYE